MNLKTHFLKPTLLILFLSLVSPSVFSQSVEKKAALLMEENQAALVVITTQSVIKATGSGTSLPERPQQGRTLGITVSDTGLIVASNSAIDGSVGLVGQKVQVDGKLITINSASSQFGSLEISYGDAKTLTGKIVWQDLDADLVFIRPNTKEGIKFSKIDLANFAVLPNVADRVAGISRTSSVFGYMPTLMMGRITGTFKTPKSEGSRIYYLNTAGNSVGMPIFTIDGKPLGLTVNRIVKGQPTGILTTLSAGTINVVAKMAEAAK